VKTPLPGIGRSEIRSNRATVELDPVALPFKANWNEDLNKDRVLMASAEIEIKGVTIGARGEFDESGLKSAEVTAAVSVGAGPLQAKFDAVAVEFDRNGVTDVRAQALVNLDEKTVMSWNAGTSAAPSSNFDPSLF